MLKVHSTPQLRTTIKPCLSALSVGIALSTSKKDEMLRKEALEYHEAEPQGKIKVVPTKPHATAHELSLAYSPGVAYPCLEIEERPEDAYRYTSKGNLVAVISNGTAVLGLGNIGALASKPVMEGKGLLLKTFAGIDVFDIEVDTEDPEEFINTVVNISKTFGASTSKTSRRPNALKSSVAFQRPPTFPSCTTTSTARPSSPQPPCSTLLNFKARRWPTSRSSSLALEPRPSPVPTTTWPSACR